MSDIDALEFINRDFISTREFISQYKSSLGLLKLKTQSGTFAQVNQLYFPDSFVPNWLSVEHQIEFKDKKNDYFVMSLEKALPHHPELILWDGYTNYSVDLFKFLGVSHVIKVDHVSGTLDNRLFLYKANPIFLIAHIDSFWNEIGNLLSINGKRIITQLQIPIFGFSTSYFDTLIPLRECFDFEATKSIMAAKDQKEYFSNSKNVSQNLCCFPVLPIQVKHFSFRESLLLISKPELSHLESWLARLQSTPSHLLSVAVQDSILQTCISIFYYLEKICHSSELFKFAGPIFIGSPNAKSLPSSISTSTTTTQISKLSSNDSYESSYWVSKSGCCWNSNNSYRSLSNSHVKLSSIYLSF